MLKRSGWMAPSWLLLSLVVVLFAARLAAAGSPDKVDFSRQIRPILSDKCFKCHGPDEEHREADLRLDVAEGAFADLGGYRAIVPGDPDESELYRRITAEDEDERMPPRDSGKSLTKAQVELIRRWIEQGAQWKQHWAFVAPQRPPLPAVKRMDWVINPIDRFVLARLEAEGLAPSPPADRRTLIRRVTFDLTGLPPTLEEVHAFLADTSPAAYENLVDRLLESEHYGEHMARFWLDAARYGDTHGLHLDNYREMWPYRDWVIRAFNNNMPYDQFTIEQLAGDLLPNPTLDQLIATGFNRCHVTTNEGGSIAEEVYVRNVVDRVSTTGTVFLGLTLGCAVCHDHKFDPITQKEFYQLFAFFNNLDGNPMDGNVKDPAPVVRVPTAQQRAELAEIDRKLQQLTARRNQRVQQIGPQLADWIKQQEQGEDRQVASYDVPDGLVAYLKLDQQQGAQAADEIAADKPGAVRGTPDWVAGRWGGGFRCGKDTYIDLGQRVNWDGKSGFSYGAWIQTPGNITGAAIAKMDDRNLHRGCDLYVTGRRIAVHLINRWPSYAIKVTTRKDVLKPGKWHHVFVTYDGSKKAAGVAVYVDGQPQPLVVNSDSLRDNDTITNGAPLQIGRRHPGSPFAGGVVDEVRLYDRQLSPTEVATVAGAGEVEAILAKAPAERTAKDLQLLRNWYLNRHDAEYRKLTAELERLRRQRRKVEAAAPTTLVFRERAEPRQAYLLVRGQYDRRGDPVERRTPAALPPMAEDLPRNRLGLARWLVSPEHPLTARVAVNRFWQQCFGTGLVKTSEDFGSQGEPPSHPQLLDWLAVDFRESGWDVKRLMKMIVMSATYRQSSRITPELRQRDPDNRLLARGPRFRLDAEMLRDQALAISGLLVRQLGGPSVKPPQPDGLWFAVGYSGSNTVRFVADKEPEKIYRRSLYTFWKRTAPPPQMSTFDAPSRESCVVRRERTNTPLQALLLMNDPQYVEAARHLAQRILREAGPTAEARAAFAFELATARPPTPKELHELVAAYRDHRATYQKQPEDAEKLIHVGPSQPDPTLDPVDLAAWTMVANLILNLDEVITKG